MVELGCWPGGWLQVLVERVGPEGRVVGCDLEAIDPLDGAVFLQLDFTEPEALDAIAAALERPADAVVSDAAPKLSGIRDVDRAAQEELYEAALAVAGRVLKPGGTLLMKGFPGPESDRLRKRLRGAYKKVTEVRPEARRGTSKEFYWVASGRKPE